MSDSSKTTSTFTSVDEFGAFSKAFQARDVKVGQHDFLIKIVFTGIVGAILLIAINLCQDSSLHSRITELERDVADYRVEQLGNSDQLHCPSWMSVGDCLRSIK